MGPFNRIYFSSVS